MLLHPEDFPHTAGSWADAGRSPSSASAARRVEPASPLGRCSSSCPEQPGALRFKTTRSIKQFRKARAGRSSGATDPALLGRARPVPPGAVPTLLLPGTVARSPPERASFPRCAPRCLRLLGWAAQSMAQAAGGGSA